MNRQGPHGAPFHFQPRGPRSGPLSIPGSPMARRCPSPRQRPPCPLGEPASAPPIRWPPPLPRQGPDPLAGSPLPRRWPLGEPALRSGPDPLAPRPRSGPASAPLSIANPLITLAFDFLLDIPLDI